MTARHKQRLMFVITLVIAFGIATVLVLYSLDKNLLYFYTPSQISEQEEALTRQFNLGGLVKQDSVQQAGMVVHFEITDTIKTVPVVYTGLLPDLFREGQGIIATGSIDTTGVFIAERVLAKHDENYMPPEVAEVLEQAGYKQPIGVKATR